MTTESSQELREKLAEVQHEIWAHWMKYLFQISAKMDDGTYIISLENVKRWKRQIGLSYSELSERGKDSDRDQANKVLAVSQAQFQEQFLRLGEELRKRTAECDKLRTDIVGLLDELIEERQQRIEANALLLATARALDLDDDEVDELPQRVANLRAKLERAQDAIRWLWGFWDGNTLMASPGADHKALDEAWDRLLKVL